MTKEEIFKEYFTNWISATGLGRLDLKDTTPWAVKGESVKNENGILFFSLFIATSVLAGIETLQELKDRIKETIFSLEKEPGLFNRQPYGFSNAPRLEAADNYVGIEFLSLYFNLPFKKDIVKFGQDHIWNYNNINPKTFLLSQERQPGEVAFYKICSGDTPSLFDLLYFLAGVTINSFKNKDYRGEAQLCWLRLMCLHLSEMPTWVAKFISPVKRLWFWRFKKKYGTLSNMFNGYFIESHPIVLMAKLLGEKSFL